MAAWREETALPDHDEGRRAVRHGRAWEQWEDLQTFAIIVTQGNLLMKPIHDRIQVILRDDSWDHWLTANDISIPMALLES